MNKPPAVSGKPSAWRLAGKRSQLKRPCRASEAGAAALADEAPADDDFRNENIQYLRTKLATRQTGRLSLE
jgi:hypothetical protein